MSTATSVYGDNDAYSQPRTRLAGRHVRPAHVNVTTWMIAGLGTIALAISTYLAWTGLTAGKVAGCGSGLLDCEHVMNTRWSNWMGVPVGVGAALLYVSAPAALWTSRMARTTRLQTAATSVLVTLGFAAGSAAVWFTSLQIFQIGHLCPWCLASHACGLAIAAILIWKKPLGRRLPVLPTLLALMGLTALVSGQLLAAPPQTYEVQHFEPAAPAGSDVEASPAAPADAGHQSAPEPELFAPPTFDLPPAADTTTDQTSNTDSGSVAIPVALLKRTGNANYGTHRNFSPVAQAGMPPIAALIGLVLLWQTGFGPRLAADENLQTSQQSTDSTATPAREVTFGSGTRLKISDWPLLGSTDAKYVFVEMFDYTCPHCRETHHRTIRELKQIFGRDLAVVALPVPLNSKCNSAVQTSGGQHADACRLAELAVAVWLADRQKFSEFHDWMFDSHRARTAAEAQAQAAALVGTERLQKMVSHPACRAYISRHVELYRKVGAGAVPKLLFPGTALVGQVGSAQHVADILERQYGAR